ncbi:hypothetical protein IFO68_18160 [Photobacterium sp. CAU 1568]|uniref:Uncharacterized protein n=1 Tax=Photobacterium arenosum TaxID=2774143 RepID=A0ABR9BSH1_9GAMM|nr:hypothetical protein [Photobacterium arenosum]MBD8514610.1 hypothetical protein [Photobacterium arenosum]
MLFLRGFLFNELHVWFKKRENFPTSWQVWSCQSGNILIYKALVIGAKIAGIPELNSIKSRRASVWQIQFFLTHPGIPCSGMTTSTPTMKQKPCMNREQLPVSVPESRIFIEG